MEKQKTVEEQLVLLVSKSFEREISEFNNNNNFTFSTYPKTWKTFTEKAALACTNIGLNTVEKWTANNNAALVLAVKYGLISTLADGQLAWLPFSPSLTNRDFQLFRTEIFVEHFQLPLMEWFWEKVDKKEHANMLAAGNYEVFWRMLDTKQLESLVWIWKRLPDDVQTKFSTEKTISALIQNEKLSPPTQSPQENAPPFVRVNPSNSSNTAPISRKKTSEKHDKENDDQESENKGLLSDENTSEEEEEENKQQEEIENIKLTPPSKTCWNFSCFRQQRQNNVDGDKYCRRCVLI